MPSLHTESTDSDGVDSVLQAVVKDLKKLVRFRVVLVLPDWSITGP